MKEVKYKVLKTKIITSKKSCKDFTIVLFAVNSEDDILYVKSFLPGRYSQDELNNLTVCTKGAYGYAILYDEGLTDCEVIL